MWYVQSLSPETVNMLERIYCHQQHQVRVRSQCILLIFQGFSMACVIELRYFDETGFCLVPYVPYARQDNHETVTLPTLTEPTLKCPRTDQPSQSVIYLCI